MTRSIETSLAKQDLAETIRNMARDNPAAAEHFLERIRRQYQQLADNPEIGRRRPDLARGIRSFPFNKNYIILYQLIDGGFVIVRFLHGARDIKSVM